MQQKSRMKWCDPGLIQLVIPATGYCTHGNSAHAEEGGKIYCFSGSSVLTCSNGNEANKYSTCGMGDGVY